MITEQIASLSWNKSNDGLLPAIVQHAQSGAVLMLGYVSKDSLAETLSSKRVTFFSRTRQRIWQKGETSGNYLTLVSIAPDCDNDTLLIQALPAGPICHNGTPTCFASQNPMPSEDLSFLTDLEAIIGLRITEKSESSYTARLFAEGPARIAQKIGEEGVEVALAAVAPDDAKIVSESADLMYHLLLLLKSRNLSLTQVAQELKARHAQRSR